MCVGVELVRHEVNKMLLIRYEHEQTVLVRVPASVLSSIKRDGLATHETAVMREGFHCKSR